GPSITSTPFIVREYAHQNKSSADEVRTDFTETLYWHPALVLPGDGPAEVTFQLSDAVTSFRILVAGHSLDGRLGEQQAIINSQLPFSIEPKIPMEISSTDKVTLPVTLANETPQNRVFELAADAK